jgi:hypothetical protein
MTFCNHKDYVGILLAAVFAASFPATGRCQAPSGAPPPTFADVAYGPHVRHVLDFWQANASEPTPLAIFIHGGGFVNGDKSGLTRSGGNRAVLTELLSAGISVASISYRLLGQAPLPAAYHDGRLALQFLRSKAETWHIDKTRIAAWGGSAGAQICMYLAFHDDMADPLSQNAVERESTRLTCVATNAGQTTMDLDWWLANVPGYDQPHRDFMSEFAAKSEAEYRMQVLDVSALALISADDPPIFMSYRMAPDDPVPSENARGWKIHHVIFGVKLKEKMDRFAIDAFLKYPGARPDHDSLREFLIANLR